MTDSTAALGEEIMSILRDTIEEKEKAANAAYARSQELRAQYDRILRTDEILIAAHKSALELGESYTSLCAEVFTPGTVLFYDNGYWVVERCEGSYVYTYEVTEKPNRRQRTDCLGENQVKRTRIVSLGDITNPKMRKFAETLIARVRLKEW